jgi:hypothetical protein
MQGFRLLSLENRGGKSGEKLDLSGAQRAWDNFALFLPGAFSSLDGGDVAGYMKTITQQARSSGGEHYLDAVGVRGSNPRVPTRYIQGLRSRP